MLLFLMFLIFSLFIISGAASAYGRISDNFSEIFSSSAAVRYISNKIRSGDSSELYQEGRAVVIDCGSINCVIYSDMGGLYEKYTDKDEILIFAGGDLIFSGTKVKIAENDGLYYIVAETGNDVFSAYCKA